MGAESRVGGDEGAAHRAVCGSGRGAGVRLAVAGWEPGPLVREGGAVSVGVLKLLFF